MKKLFYIIFFILCVNSIWSQSLVTSGPMADGRMHHGSVKLDDGKILAFGGYNGNVISPDYYNTSEIYNPTTGTWSTTGNMKLKRSGIAYAKLPGGRVLVSGGYNGVTDFASTEIYNVNNGTWSYTDSMSFARSFHKAVVLNNDKVLIVGGPSLTPPEIFDPNTNTWSTTGYMHFNHGMDFSMTKLNDGRVLVVGGDGKKDSAEIYDPVLESWFKINVSTIYSRIGHEAILLGNGKVLIVGNVGFSNTDKAELFDPVTNTFIETDSLEEGRAFSPLLMLNNGNVMIFGFGNLFNLSNNNIIEVYDVASNNWYSHDFPTFGVNGYTIHQLNNGKVIILGGNQTTGNGASVTTWLFTSGVAGIKDIAKGVLNIYPNPAIDRLLIDFDNSELFRNKKLTIKILDQFGRVMIDEKEITDPENIIDLSEYSSGIYFYVIHDRNEQLDSGKFVVIK